MADNLPSFPADPLDEKQMTEFVLLCLEKEQNYKKYSDKIGASCADGSKTPLKVQKQVIDRIKEVIKAKPQKHSAKQKFFALKLLNKVVMKKNIELNNYVEAKIMSRLTILAEFNNNPEEKSAQMLLSRGKNIFGPDEPDHQNSANFLIILLDCIEKWALTFAFEEGEVDDAVSQSTRSKSKKGDKFYNSYTKLLDKGVKFPSTFQAKDRQASKKKPAQADQDEGPPQQARQPPAGNVADDAQSQSAASQYGISPEKKERIGQLKKKMQKVKEMSKQAKKFIDKSAQNKDVDVAEVLQLQSVLEENKKLGEDAISELMSDDIQPHISNSEQLAEKLFGYQELYEKALKLIEKKIEEQRKMEEDMALGGRGSNFQQPKVERKNSFNSEENENVDEGIGSRDENRIAVSRTSMAGRASRMGGDHRPPSSMMTNTTNTMSEIQFQMAGPAPDSARKKPSRNELQARAGGFDTNSNQNSNPYDFDNFGASNKGMFSTFQNKAQGGFNDFNFDMAPQDDMQKNQGNSNAQVQNDFGFDFGGGPSVSKSQPMKGKVYKEKPPVSQDEDEDAVIQPRAARAAQQNQGQPSKAAAPTGNVDENYTSRELQDQVEDQRFQEGDNSEFEGRKRVNQSLKNKNNISEFQSRNSQIAGHLGRPGAEPNRPSNVGKSPAAAAGDFDFNFPSGAPQPSPIQQANQSQNDGFNFQFDSKPSPSQAKPNDGFDFNDMPAASKPAAAQGFDDFNFGGNQQQPSARDDFFSYAGQPAASEQKPPPQNQDFNDFGFDSFNAQQANVPQIGDRMKEEEISSSRHKPEAPSPDDGQIDSSRQIPQQQAFDDFSYQESSQAISGFADQSATPVKVSSLEDASPLPVQVADKLSPNKEIFDYAEELAARKKAGPGMSQINSTMRVQMPTGAEETSESMGSRMSEDIPEKLKSEKDKEIEKEIKELREYVQDDRIARWWQGQQGQGRDELQAALNQNYGLHQKSLMTKISTQVSQAEQLQTQIYSLEQENKMLTDKYQQLVSNQSEDARRVSELEFEVDSFNSQINIIRQQCEQELRRKDDEVQEMKRTVEAMRVEVETANQRSLQVQAIEDNANHKLAMKDQEIEGLRKQLQDAQLDSQAQQQKLSDYDMDKKDYEKQIRNLQSQLAEEIGKSEISQAKDMEVANIKEAMQKQFSQRENEMQAKISELEAQLSMALAQDMRSKMGNKEQLKDSGSLVNENAQPFNLPQSKSQVMEKPIEQHQLEVNTKQDSASSGTNIFNSQRPSQGQAPNFNQNQFLDFSSNVPGSQSQLVPPSQTSWSGNPESAKKAPGLQGQAQNLPNEGNMGVNQAQYANNIQTAAQGPGSSSQVVQPNPSFSFDMFGTTQSEAQVKQSEMRPSTSMAMQPMSSQSNFNMELGAQSQLHQQQQSLTPRQDQSRSSFQTTPAQLNAMAQDTDHSATMRASMPMPPNQEMLRPSPIQQSPGLSQSMSMKTLPNTGLNQGAQQQPSQMQAQFQQNFQHELLKQKLQSFHVNSLIQGDKCVIYEDVNVKIGLVRQYKPPQGPNGEIKCLFKVFFRNQNQQQLPMHGVQFQFQGARGQPNFVKIARSSRPLPVRVPGTPPLNHNETIELDCDLTIAPMANPNAMAQQQSASVPGVKSLKFAGISLQLQYELNNGKKSGLLQITIPINVLNFLAPCKSLNKYEYQGIWNKVLNTPQGQRPPNAACMQTIFTLDKQKVANMKKLMETMAMCFHHVPEVDPQPNQLSFVAQLKDFCLSDPNQERAWLLVKMELTKEGGNCKLQCVAVKDNLALAVPTFESVLALIAKQA